MGNVCGIKWCTAQNVNILDSNLSHRRGSTLDSTKYSASFCKSEDPQVSISDFTIKGVVRDKSKKLPI